jgi:hypothetical protein
MSSPKNAIFLTMNSNIQKNVKKKIQEKRRRLTSFVNRL